MTSGGILSLNGSKLKHDINDTGKLLTSHGKYLHLTLFLSRRVDFKKSRSGYTIAPTEHIGLVSSQIPVKTSLAFASDTERDDNLCNIPKNKRAAEAALNELSQKRDSRQVVYRFPKRELECEDWLNIIGICQIRICQIETI